jgi:hypothetical protein
MTCEHFAQLILGTTWFAFMVDYVIGRTQERSRGLEVHSDKS